MKWIGIYAFNKYRQWPLPARDGDFCFYYLLCLALMRYHCLLPCSRLPLQLYYVNDSSKRDGVLELLIFWNQIGMIEKAVLAVPLGPSSPQVAIDNGT